MNFSSEMQWGWTKARDHVRDHVREAEGWQCGNTSMTGDDTRTFKIDVYIYIYIYCAIPVG